MSGKKGLLKRGQPAADKGWMTGFNNRDRLLRFNELSETRQQADNLEQQLKAARKNLGDTRDQIKLYELLGDTEFNAIDLPSAQRELDALQSRLEALTAPDSDVEKARREFETVRQKLEESRKQLSQQETTLALLEEKRNQATARCTELLDRIGEGLTDDQQSLAAKHFRAPKADQRTPSPERTNESNWSKPSANWAKDPRKLSLTQLMEKALTIDTGALIEPVATSRTSRNTWNACGTEEESPPQKPERFLSYPNQSSIRGSPSFWPISRTRWPSLKNGSPT